MGIVLKISVKHYVINQVIKLGSIFSSIFCMCKQLAKRNVRYSFGWQTPTTPASSAWPCMDSLYTGLPRKYFSLCFCWWILFRLNYPFLMRKWHHACTSWNGKTGEWQLWVKAERVGRGFHNRVSFKLFIKYF